MGTFGISQRFLRLQHRECQLVAATVACWATILISANVSAQPIEREQFAELPEIRNWETWEVQASADVPTVLAAHLPWWSALAANHGALVCQQPEAKAIASPSLRALAAAWCSTTDDAKRSSLLLAGESDQPAIASAAGQALAALLPADSVFEQQLYQRAFNVNFRLSLGGALLRLHSYALAIEQFGIVNHMRAPEDYSDENCLRGISIQLASAHVAAEAWEIARDRPSAQLNYYLSSKAGKKCLRVTELAACQVALWTTAPATDAVLPACVGYVAQQQARLASYVNVAVRAHWPRDLATGEVWLQLAELAAIAGPSELTEVPLLQAVEHYVCAVRGPLERKRLTNVFKKISPNQTGRRTRLKILQRMQRGNGTCAPESEPNLRVRTAPVFSIEKRCRDNPLASGCN